MSLLVALVLLDVVEVVPANYQCSLHLQALHDPRQDSTTDGDIAGEGTLLVNVRPVGGLWQSIE